MNNRKIIIFGASGGLGSKISELFQNNTTYNIVKLSSADLDVTNEQDVSNFFNINDDVFCVVNLFGVNYDGFAHKIQSNNIKNMIDVNIYGTINVCKYAIDKMRKNNIGKIINISSILTEKTTIGTSIYTGTKCFIDGYTKVIASENISKNINCNSIKLGYFDGGMTYKIPQDTIEQIKNNIPIGRFGKIDELYNTINYLINTEYISGQSINISGGL